MILIGHRGAKGEMKANTLASVQRAIDSGVDMIEFDVMTTRDNVPVLYHGLRFTSKGRRQLPERMSFEELQSLKPDIASLDEVLNICNNIMVDIDLKTSRVDPIIDMVEKHFDKSYINNNILFSSHLFDALRNVRRRLPQAKIAVYNSAQPMSWPFYHWRIKLFAVGFPKKFRWFIQPIAHAMGLKTYIYSVNSKRLADKYAKMGTWAIVTDNPSSLVGRKD